MTHLTDAQLIAHAIDGRPFPSDARQHLAICDGCRSRDTALAHLAAELSVAQRSAVSLGQQRRYYALFDQIEQTPGLSPAKLWQRLVASLVWDGRQQPGLAGVRGGAASFRLLYATAVAEVELLVESGAAGQRLEGEILDLADGDLSLPALVQLLDKAGVAQFETTTDDRGRFRLDAVPVQSHDLLITPARGPQIVLNRLDLS